MSLGIQKNELHYHVLVLNFRDFSFGEGYNPLTMIWDAQHSGRKDEAVEQMNDFVESISASQKSARNVDPFWWQTAATFTGMSIKKLENLCDRDYWMTAEEAVRSGVVDMVGQLQRIKI